MNSLAIFGGTFDPVHNGHIQTSIAIQSHFNFDFYYFLPCRIPTIKPPAFASSAQRIEMLQIAIKNHPQFKLDLREIKRDSPSYMVDTLRSFRKDNEHNSISLVMGYDAFFSLPQWQQWEAIIKLANILVINRDQFSSNKVPQQLKELLTHHQCTNKADLTATKAGLIYFFDAGNYEISSTSIRNCLRNNLEMNLTVPKEVYEYIKLQGLYQ